VLSAQSGLFCYRSFYLFQDYREINPVQFLGRKLLIIHLFINPAESNSPPDSGGVRGGFSPVIAFSPLLVL
jgi:hypothetical protein